MTERYLISVKVCIGARDEYTTRADKTSKMNIYDPTDEFDEGFPDELPTVEEFDSHHDSVVEEYNLKYTGLNRNVTNPGQKVHAILQDADEQEDSYMKAATLLRRLPVLHVYEDGNKRTTWLTVTDYLDRKGAQYPDDPEQVEKVMKQIRSFSIDELSEWLRTGEIELRR